MQNLIVWEIPITGLIVLDLYLLHALRSAAQARGPGQATELLVAIGTGVVGLVAAAAWSLVCLTVV